MRILISNDDGYKAKGIKVLIKELEKINFVEELELHGLMSIKSWKSLSKLKSLKTFTKPLI